MTNRAQPKQAAAPATPAEGQNLRHLVGWRRTALRLAGAVGSGLLLSAAYPLIEFAPLVWVALLPLLLVPPPATLSRRLLLGWIFGFAHAATNLFWLNQVGFGAGFLLALPVACYPMLWYGLFTALLDAWREERDDGNPCPGLEGVRRPVRQLATMLLGAALWVGVEWLQSWLFTGFPWNFLGVALWQSPVLLRTCAFTGVYGISFLVAAVNLALALRIHDFRRSWREGERPDYSWPLAGLVVLFLPVLASAWFLPALGPPDRHLRVLAVQGNIPQCREWRVEDFENALEVYVQLTRDQAPALDVELVVWPETAVPAPLGYSPYLEAVRELQAYTRIPLLLGTVDYRPDETGMDDLSFNSAILLDAEARVVEYYDKIQRVPFGEFVPFSRHLPWLVEWIGMGRDLTPGSEFTLFDLPQGVRAGVNICFEDAFPYISRGFVQRGANVLMTITNDSWYAESSGSRQHLLQAVFRAAETRRPMLRVGNNSDTCLILPDGSLSGLLRNPDTGNPFYRGAEVYEIPVWDDLPLTFHTRHGDLFAIFCALVSLALAAGVAHRAYAARAALRAQRLDPPEA